MSLALTEHILYLSLIIGIILRVGHQLHRVGGAFVNMFLPHNPALATQVNNLLLVAYYLVNVGYAFLLLVWFQTDPQTIQALIESLSLKIGGIVLLLGLLHIHNMFWIYFFGRRTQTMSHTKLPTT